MKKIPYEEIANLVPTGHEICEMSKEEVIKWAEIVLCGGQKGEDVFKLAKAFGGFYTKNLWVEMCEEWIKPAKS